MNITNEEELVWHLLNVPNVAWFSLIRLLPAQTVSAAMIDEQELYFMFVIIQMILSFVGFAKMKKR